MSKERTEESTFFYPNNSNIPAFFFQLSVSKHFIQFTFEYSQHEARVTCVHKCDTGVFDLELCSYRIQMITQMYPLESRNETMRSIIRVVK